MEVGTGSLQTKYLTASEGTARTLTTCTLPWARITSSVCATCGRRELSIGPWKAKSPASSSIMSGSFLKTMLSKIPKSI